MEAFLNRRLRLPALEPRQWSASAVLVALLGVNMFAGFSLIGEGDAAARVRRASAESAMPKALPSPEPLNFRSVAPLDAVAINAGIPLAGGANPAARPFALAARGSADTLRALDCLTSAIYYEAATEPVEGQRAVAQVVLNRVRHPAFPNSVCGVVYQGSERVTGCQFTFTCDGSLRRAPMASYWDRARKIAEEAMAGKVYAPVGHATHYHTNWVVPYWSSSLVKLANVGTHIFYRWSGGWGKPAAFSLRASGIEPVINLAALRAREPVVPSLDETDVAAAAAAAAALEGEDAPLASIDSFQRAVLRRYEPMPGAAVASLLAEQAKATQPVTKAEASHRWAMTGQAPDTAGVATAKAPEQAKPAQVKPAPPACLEGVKKSEGTAAEPAKPLTC